MQKKKKERNQAQHLEIYKIYLMMTISHIMFLAFNFVDLKYFFIVNAFLFYKFLIKFMMICEKSKPSQTYPSQKSFVVFYCKRYYYYT